MSARDPAVEAAQRAWDRNKVRSFHVQRINAAREALAPLKELHKPHWMNCIKACCSGKECKHRSSLCSGCDEYWPCSTAELIYTDDELTGGEA